MKKNIISMAAAMAVLSACGPGVPQLGKSSLDEVIGAMTLEEKAHLVVGTGMAGFSGDSAVIGATRKLVRAKIRRKFETTKFFKEKIILKIPNSLK